MKILKTYNELFENDKIDYLYLIQNTDKEELLDKYNDFNLGEKLVWNYIYRDPNIDIDDETKKLINIDYDYTYELKKYAYDYNRIILSFENEDLISYFELDYDYSLGSLINYISYNKPEELCEISELVNYFNYDKIKKLLKLKKDAYLDKILEILYKTSLKDDFDEVKWKHEYSILYAKTKIAEEIDNNLMYEFSYNNATKKMEIEIYLKNLDEHKTVNEFLLSYKNILSKADKIEYEYQIDDDDLEEIPKYVNIILSKLENNIDQIINTLNINIYDISDISKMGGVFLDYIKTKKFQESFIQEQIDVYDLEQVYDNLRYILAPGLEKKYFSKLIAKKYKI